MRALDTLGTKSGNFQQSTNKLEETPWFFLVTIVSNTWDTIPSTGFFSVCLMIGNFL